MSSPRQSRSYTVSEVAQLLSDTLRSTFPTMRVVGEISNFFRARSGHWYFRLKDDKAQIECAMFAADARGVAFAPADGDEVEITGQLDYYVPGGKLQLKCRLMQRAGEGRLLAAFEQLKKKLAGEGLFDDGLKRPLPRFPRAIGLVTSSDAAALRDILTTLERRWPMPPIYLLPVLVQGDQAAPQITEALRQLPQRAPEVEVIILARGGGSIEDLWAFNEEIVARAIRACTVPVITGVGHETDTTIADFAADLRAPTPTGAAERVAPDQVAVTQRLAELRERLYRAESAVQQTRRHQLDALQRRLQRVSPLQRIETLAQRNDELQARLSGMTRRLLAPQGSTWQALVQQRARLSRAVRAALEREAQRLQTQRSLLRAQHPRKRIAVDAPAQLERLRSAMTRTMQTALAQAHDRAQDRQQRCRAQAPLRRLHHEQQALVQLHRRLHHATRMAVFGHQQALQRVQEHLTHLGPPATLARGYAIVQRSDGAILRDPSQTQHGERLRLRLAQGSLQAITEKQESEGGDSSA
ncbi:MAG: exodeoxyribonuclease VII large subunit [Algiphilus sp.]